MIGDFDAYVQDEQEQRQIHIEMLCNGIIRDLEELLIIINDPSERMFADIYMKEIREKSYIAYSRNVANELAENMEKALKFKFNLIMKGANHAQ